MARRVRAVRGLASVITQSLRAELNRRQSGVATLQRRHDVLMRQAAEIADEIAAMGGGVVGATGRRGPGRPPGRPAGRRTRPHNELSLVEALQKALSSRTLSVTEAAQQVQTAGYRTSSANFRTIVNQTLIKSNKFRKVSRGKYTAR